MIKNAKSLKDKARNSITELKSIKETIKIL